MSEIIRILGVNESTRMRLLKLHVEEAMRRMGLSIPIEEVNEIDQLMEYGIIGIPALLIGQRILFQQEVPEVEHIIKALTNSLQLTGKHMDGIPFKKPPEDDSSLNFE
jgi:hypothetical protein